MSPEWRRINRRRWRVVRLKVLLAVMGIAAKTVWSRWTAWNADHRVQLYGSRGGRSYDMSTICQGIMPQPCHFAKSSLKSGSGQGKLRKRRNGKR